MKIVKILKSIFEGVIAVMGAFAMSQLPAFMQQYTQRLSGHVDELANLLQSLQKNAAISNKSLEQYIDKFLTNADPDFVLQGEFMSGMTARWHMLNDQLSQLMQSTLWEKPFVFIKGLQSPIFQSTLETFQPGINLTAEGLIYAGAGVVITFVIYHLILNGICMIGRAFYSRPGHLKEVS